MRTAAIARYRCCGTRPDSSHQAWLSDLRGDRPPCTLSNPSTSTPAQQRVWEVLSDLEAWPQRIETVDVVELLTPAPVGEGSRVRLKQPKLPEGTWEVTVWDAPSYFEFRQKSGGVTNVAGHRVAALEEGRSRLTLTLDMRGLLVPVVASVLQGPDQPLHDRRGSGHEARSRVRLRREEAVKRHLSAGCPLRRGRNAICDVAEMPVECKSD